MPQLVATSFNMHEEPIVCTPEDAIRSFEQGHLEYLAMGNFLVYNSDLQGTSFKDVLPEHVIQKNYGKNQI